MIPMFDSWPQEQGKVEERRLGGENSIAQAGSGNIQLFIFTVLVWLIRTVPESRSGSPCNVACDRFAFDDAP